MISQCTTQSGGGFRRHMMCIEEIAESDWMKIIIIKCNCFPALERVQSLKVHFRTVLPTATLISFHSGVFHSPTRRTTEDGTTTDAAAAPLQRRRKTNFLIVDISSLELNWKLL